MALGENVRENAPVTEGVGIDREIGERTGEVIAMSVTGTGTEVGATSATTVVGIGEAALLTTPSAMPRAALAIVASCPYMSTHRCTWQARRYTRR